MKKIIRRFQHHMTMRRLSKRFDYVIGKMKEHEHDADSKEWRAWAQLNLLYLMLMDKEVNDYALKNKIES